MKNTIIRNITILMSLSLLLSTVLVVALGIFLSEGLFIDTRAIEFIPDLTVVAELTAEYQEGRIGQATYETVLRNASQGHTSKYFVVNADATILYTTEDLISSALQLRIQQLSAEVLAGKKVINKFKDINGEPVVLVGVPLIKDKENSGAVFVLVDTKDLTIRRHRFYGSIAVALVVVIPFFALFSYFILMRIIKPIKNVAKVAISMIQGDFSVRADETLEGEIGLMGRTINKLSIELYRNISQLYIEKNRLHQVLYSLEEGMIAVNENREVTHFNNVFLEMFELSEEMLKGKKLDEVTVLTQELAALKEAIEAQRSVIKKGVHGETIIRIIIAPIENEKGENAGAVFVFKDITELEKLEIMRRDYVANVSHELRSPLTSIRGLIEPLMDSIVTNQEDVQRYYKIIYKESLRLSRLVDDIMELSRLQTNEAVIQKTPTSLSPILEMVHERFRVLDESISLVYEPTELPMVLTNYDRVEQILVILLDNAYKFTPEGGTIVIATEMRARDIVISVKDTGTGILKEDLPFVFDRFYKSDKSRTKIGTGLGLSIAKEILTIMGEEISVKSEYGVGSEFCFTVHYE